MLSDPRIAFESWINVRLSKYQKKKWCICFFSMVWYVWEARNKIIFEKEPFLLINAMWFYGTDGSFGPKLGVLKSIIGAESAIWELIKVYVNGDLLSWCLICGMWNQMSLWVCCCDIQLVFILFRIVVAMFICGWVDLMFMLLYGIVVRFFHMWCSPLFSRLGEPWLSTRKKKKCKWYKLCYTFIFIKYKTILKSKIIINDAWSFNEQTN